MNSSPNPTAMIHLFRGELGRMTVYRVRLDTTTNWALGATVAVSTFALGKDEVPHVVLAIPYVLCAVFAFIEARRFQDLELSRRRVRLLETGFFAQQLGGAASNDWLQPLLASLRDPVPPIPLVEALGERVRRNYLWLFLILYGAWFVKLGLSHIPLLQAASIGDLSGEVVMGLAVVLLLPWIGICFTRRDVARG